MGQNTNANQISQENQQKDLTNEKLVLKGDLKNNRLQQNQNQNSFQITNDSQTFQLPASSAGQPFNFTGGPNPCIENSSNLPPQFHFIANQQKFYAQGPSDKTPLLIRSNSDKRPFTAANASHNTGNGNATSGTKSHNNSQSKTGRQNSQSNGGVKAAGMNPMPYIQLASKTHTGSFPLTQMQMNAHGSKYVSSTGQLETQNPHNAHLVSVFAQNSQNPMLAGANSATLQNILNANHVKVSKIKPNRNNIKEKEQLYEEAIKLKIQSNSIKEENLKLKTKIKILENEMAKKEKGLEDFISKMSTSQPNNNNYANMFYPSKNQPQQQVNGTNNVMQSVQKIQSESFLVVNLKKQLRDQKLEIAKKDEELDLIRKNIKNTQKVETDAEIKTYKDELLRMRSIMEELMKEGPDHPIYQQQALDKIAHLEQQKQQQDYHLKQLQQDNQELAQLVQQSEEQLMKKNEEKEKKSDIKSELSKVKKTLKEKEKEISKLKVELLLAKKNSSSENSSAINGQNASQSKPEDKKDSSQVEKEVKTMQKKVKDLQSDLKSKKEKIDQQDEVIRKLQERLQSKIDEVGVEQQKVKEIEAKMQDIKKVKEHKDKIDILSKEIKKECAKEIEVLVIIAKKSQISYDQMIEKIVQQDQLVKDLSLKLKDFFKESDIETIRQVIPTYILLNPAQQLTISTTTLNHLSQYKSTLKQAIDTDNSTLIPFTDFQSALDSLDIVLSPDQLDYLKITYYDSLASWGNKQDVGFNFSGFLQDLKIHKNTKKIPQNEEKPLEGDKKKARPQTAKSNQSQQQNQQKSSQDLKKIEEDEADEQYEEDFEDPNYQSEKVNKSKIEKSQVQEADQEPIKPQLSEHIESSSNKKLSKSIDLKDQQKDEPMEEQRFLDEEEMLDVAEHCFIRIAEMLIEKNKSARQIFTKYSVPEQFPDGTVLELMSPIAFLEGVKEAGMDALSEMEATCLLRVLAKAELDNAIILNEFAMIMENFGVMDTVGEEDDDDDDYVRSEDEEEQSKSKIEEHKKEDNKEEEKKDEKPPKKRKIKLEFEMLEEKGLKILQKLARFLLERYLHPREFFGPAIYKQLVKTKTRENNVDILQTKDFYLRLKIAGIRKTVKEVDNLNKFLSLDAKFPLLMQVKKVVKALEEVAQGEQIKMHEEMLKKQEEMEKEGALIGGAKVETEEDEGDIGEEERQMKKAMAMQQQQQNTGINQDLASLGSNNSPMTGGPQGYSSYMGGMGGYDYNMLKPPPTGPQSKIAMLMGFNHLNTIEEEKHETQNSNYFRDGGESERDDITNNSNIFGKNSRLLDEDHLDHSGSNKPSPVRNEDLLLKTQAVKELAQEEDAEEDSEDLKSGGEDQKLNDEDNKQEEEESDKEDEVKEEMEPQYDTDNPRIETEKDADRSIQDMKSVQSQDQDNEYEEDESDYEF